jgi:hypothetical protein
MNGPLSLVDVRPLARSNNILCAWNQNVGGLKRCNDYTARSIDYIPVNTRDHVSSFDRFGFLLEEPASNPSSRAMAFVIGTSVF